MTGAPVANVAPRSGVALRLSGVAVAGDGGEPILRDIDWELDRGEVAFEAGFEHGEVYRNVDASLSRVPVAIVYIIANIALGIHLFHGTWSLFQSVGWNNPRFNRWRKGLAAGVATVVVVGNVSFPIMTLAGVIDYDDTVTTVHELEEASE